jgi:hypothetical protein
LLELLPIYHKIITIAYDPDVSNIRDEMSALVKAMKRVLGYPDAFSPQISEYSAPEPQDESGGPIIVFRSFDDGLHAIPNPPPTPHSFDGLLTNSLRTSKSCSVTSSPSYDYSKLTLKSQFLGPRAMNDGQVDD